MRLMIILLMLSLVVACQGAAEQHSVTWVVDGDTFYVEGVDVSIRIADIDAPELGSSRGEDAKWYLIDMIYGKDVVLDCDGVDRYERWLCVVYVDGSNVGMELVSVGLARKWIDYEGS
jgi:micrococcal nuclease